MPRTINPHLLGWGGALSLLALPALFGAPWTLSDYGFAAILCALAGGAIELGLLAATNIAYRLGTMVAVVAAFLLIWVNAAVGFLGNEDNPANAVFGFVLLFALGGAVLARFAARGMARAMTATAIAQLLAGVVGWSLGWASPGTNGVYEVTIGTGLFCGLWLISAALFARAARQSTHSRTASPSI
ncbi:hypothetical protein DMC47_09265 [Nostoc sp. 3335mG]|nr:hypothetical protein DMC47_09265 [Nostoc sp. 3335mG]